MQVFLFVLCAGMAIVVIELILWAIGWVLKIAIGLAVVAGVVVVGGMLIIWLFTKLWPLLIVGAIVGLVIVAFRLRSRFRHTLLRHIVDREMLEYQQPLSRQHGE